MEEEIRESFPKADIKLVESSGGDFRVIVDEVTIYDKKDTETFPKIFEVTNLIKNMN